MTPGEVAAIVESWIRARAAYVVAPPQFLERLRESRSARHSFAADEVQSGMGRTGACLRIEHANVKPDVIAIQVKGVVSGMPLARWRRRDP